MKTIAIMIACAGMACSDTKRPPGHYNMRTVEHGDGSCEFSGEIVFRKDEVAELEPVSTLGYGPPSFIFSQSAVLTVNPCYITEADAEEIVAALEVALEMASTIWTADGSYTDNKALDRAVKQASWNRELVEKELSKWRKRLEEMK